MNQINHQEAIRIISNTPVWPRKVAFVAMLAENMLPCYEFFHRSENWGNPDVLENIVALLYKSVLTPPDVLRAEALLCKKNLEMVMPDLDDFEGGATSYGFDCCITVDEALQFLDSQSDTYIPRVVTSIFDTLDMFIQKKEKLNSQDPDREEKIANDPFMLREINRQISLITFIQERIGERPTQLDLSECQKVNLQFGPVLDFRLLPYGR